MDKQQNLSFFEDELSQAKTKKKEFLAMMDSLIPWSEWEAEVKPHYYEGKMGNKPYELSLMLRIYVLQNLYTMSDMETAESIKDSRAFSEFCGVGSSNQIPDGDTIGRFRNRLEKADLQKKLFAQVVELLTQKGLMLKKGTFKITRENSAGDFNCTFPCGKVLIHCVGSRRHQISNEQN